MTNPFPHPTSGDEVRQQLVGVAPPPSIQDSHNAVASVVQMYGRMVAHLSDNVQRLQHELSGLVKAYQNTRTEYDRMRAENERLKAENERLNAEANGDRQEPGRGTPSEERDGQEPQQARAFSVSGRISPGPGRAVQAHGQVGQEEPQPVTVTFVDPDRTSGAV